jgi:Plavaka transposase
MLLRAAWLPRNIRNASGNGGGILLGYMPIVSYSCRLKSNQYLLNEKIEDPADPSDRSNAETLEFAQFKREVYQKILGWIFATLKKCLQLGETHWCNDDVVRILHPGILIEAQDGEESSYFCACRAALANFPCPKCLVPKSELHRLTKSFTPRTSESMRSVFELASHATSKTAKEKILRDYGLHDIKVSILNKIQPSQKADIQV